MITDLFFCEKETIHFENINLFYVSKCNIDSQQILYNVEF